MAKIVDSDGSGLKPKEYSNEAAMLRSEDMQNRLEKAVETRTLMVSWAQKLLR
jgi:hypothetical protein